MLDKLKGIFSGAQKEEKKTQKKLAIIVEMKSPLEDFPDIEDETDK